MTPDVLDKVERALEEAESDLPITIDADDYDDRCECLQCKMWRRREALTALRAARKEG